MSTSATEALRRWGVIVLVVLGPVLAIATSVIMGQGETSSSSALRVILLADACYLLALVAVIGWRVGSLVLARRRRSVGSRLHLRLTGVFALVALVPTVMVAVFATLSINLGIEAWFSERVGSVVRNALVAAEAYEREHRTNIRGDILAMANDLNRAADRGLGEVQLQGIVRQQALLRELPEAFVFNSRREIVARGEFSYLFGFEAPTFSQMARARAGEIVIVEDRANNEIRALVHLSSFFDAFLYVSRDIQGDVLALLDDTRETVKLYEQLERDRDSLLFDFALIYFGFATLVIVAAILLGLWFAERLAKPVGRLARASEAIGEGDLAARVKEERGSDEIALLSRAFNRMADQVQSQRDALVEAKAEAERRHYFIGAVLSGVTAGVIGLDEDARIDLANEAAADMLGLDGTALIDRPVAEVAPDFAPLVRAARHAPNGIAKGAVRRALGGETHEYLARIAPRIPDDPEAGHVLTFDDITALASAQRMAAWGDVARRIAHEIKNPLTPIQLSADRLRRKFVTRLDADGPKFEQYLDVIVRQAADIRRMVDEFSKFARMPEPKFAEADLGQLIREVTVLQREGRPEIAYEIETGTRPARLVCDRGLLSQCLTNLLQNAADAIDARRERTPDAPARIRIALDGGRRSYRLSVSDTGIGLPKEGRERLTEPYITTRKTGTGLGLAIVSRIAEQHGGEIMLGDAAGHNGLDGARVTLRLPRAFAALREAPAPPVAAQ
ncbi:MAG: PAS domain-containing sensor histidine kinase [Pseudomonadota bacterium]